MTTALVICNRLAMSDSRKDSKLESKVGVLVFVFKFFKDCIGYNQYNKGFRTGSKISSNHANLPVLSVNTNTYYCLYGKNRSILC